MQENDKMNMPFLIQQAAACGGLNGARIESASRRYYFIPAFLPS